MCRCSGGSEHEHYQAQVKYTKSLFNQIEYDKIRVINSKNSKNIEKVMRECYFPIPEDETTTSLISDADAQLIINIPYNSN